MRHINSSQPCGPVWRVASGLEIRGEGVTEHEITSAIEYAKWNNGSYILFGNHGIHARDIQPRGPYSNSCFPSLWLLNLSTQPRTTPLYGEPQRNLPLAAKVVEVRKVNVILLSETPSSFCRSPLEKAGCQCHFAESQQEMSEVLRHTKVDIVFSLKAQQRLSELMAQLAGSRVTMFHRLPVEEGCWWVPVLRNGENCFGMPAFRPSEFPRVLAEIVKGIIRDATLGRPAKT